MKKIFSFAAMLTIVAAAAVFTSCTRKQEPAIPEGTVIGNIAYFTDDAGVINFIKEMPDGTKDVTATEYTEIKAEEGFLVAQEESGKLNLLNLDGQSFAVAESYEVSTLAPVAPDEQPAAIVLTVVPGNNNHLAYQVGSYAPLAMVSGIKESVIPLSNGYTIFKNKDGWGFAKSEMEDATLEELKSINAVSTKDGKFYFWVNSPKFTGLVNVSGNGIKPMTPAAFKAMRNKGKLLWERDGAVGISVKSI